jgi:hypothetical protein
MGNAGGLFGPPGFVEPHDICDILGLVAPNISELHLFRDDVGEVFKASKSFNLSFSPAVSVAFYVTSFGKKCFAFTFSPIVALYRLTLRSPWSLGTWRVLEMGSIPVTLRLSFFGPHRSHRTIPLIFLFALLHLYQSIQVPGQLERCAFPSFEN